MIISKTPLRMSFVGGGSDLPSYYQGAKGAVISASIDKYIYINVNKKFDDGIRVSYSKTEEVPSVDLIEHKIVKNTLNYLNITGGIEITTIADIPSKGTGLGSSSAFTVGLLNALNAFKGCYISKSDLGRDASKIEIELCGEPIGKQDQYASACGGLNLIEFNADDSVNVVPIICPPDIYHGLESNLLMFYTGITRSASELLKSQSNAMLEKEKRLIVQDMVSLVYEMRVALEGGNLEAVGHLLHKNWQLKKLLSGGISNKIIDRYYDRAIDAGALGGKLLGAGAGGFLLFYAEKLNHDAIKKALSELRYVPFKFDNSGSNIIFFQR